MVKMVHNNYEKITDDLFWLSQKWVIKFNVRLNTYSDKYGRINYHKEVMYSKGKETYVNINRSYNYFITIESTFRNDNNLKESVYISSIDFYMFKVKFNQAMEWFVSDKYSDLFAKKDNKIFMPRGVKPLEINLKNNTIEIEPTVFEADNTDYIIGVNIFINKTEKVFVDVNKFLALVDMLNSLNMLQSAQLMINYLQRPEFGENIYDMGNFDGDYNTVPDNSKAYVPKKKDDGLSFFDKVKTKK
jgi:hypothetical protein